MSQRRTYFTLALIEQFISRARMTEVNNRSFLLPTVADVFGVGHAAEVDLHVVEVRTARHAVRGDRGGEDLVLRQLNDARLLAVARENVSTGAFLDAIVDAELALIERRRGFRVAVDDAKDLDVFEERAAKGELHAVGLLETAVLEQERFHARVNRREQRTRDEKKN